MDLQHRTVCRAQVTKIVNAANELLTTDGSTTKDLATTMAKLKLVNANLGSANLAVRPHIAATDFQKECEGIMEYEEKVLDVLAEIEVRLAENRAASTTPLLQPASQKGAATAAPPAPTAPPQVVTVNKLPKLELRKFNGDLDQWLPFWEQFKTAVHDRAELNASDKFNYLQGVLTGKAAQSIAGYTPTSQCYNDAIKLLKDEFGNIDSIIDHYMNILMNVHIVKEATDANGLRKLYNTASSTVRTLEALGVSSNEYSMVVKNILLKAVPLTLRLNFHRNDNNESNVNGESSSATTESSSANYINRLLQFVKAEVDSLDKAMRVDKSTTATRDGPRKAENRVGTATGLLTGASERCYFCDSVEHVTAVCSKLMTLQAKKDLLKRGGRCYRCTKGNHTSRDCRNKTLQCATCRGRHATTMCDPNYAREKLPTTNLLTDGCLTNILLQTARAVVSNNDINEDKYLIRLVIDGGSQLSYIKENVSRKLNLPVIGKHRLSIMAFGSKGQTEPKLCNRVKVCLRNQFNDESIEIDAIEVPEICMDTLQTPSDTDSRLTGLQLADVVYESNVVQFPGISLLVGANYYWSVVSGQIKYITERLTAIQTKLGWTLHGPQNVCGNSISLTTTIMNVASLEDVGLKRFWDLETIGIKPIDNDDDDINTTAEQFMKENIRRQNDKYEVSLPWKNCEVSLDNNYECASSRLKTLTTRLTRNSGLEEYDNAVREYVNKGFAEEVCTAIQTAGNKTYYMPHRPVYRDDKSTTRLRVVFDASSHKFGSTSLNDNLQAGENLIPDLLGILVNFRARNIGLIADIEKAFLQISLAEKDRDSHRFLWYKNAIDKESELPDMQAFRMTCVTFGVTSSPFLLAATLQKHLNSVPKNLRDTADILKDCFYVDDLVASTWNINDAKRIYSESIKILNSASMNLRKWATNDANLAKEIGDVNFNSSTRVLGINWIKNVDLISINVSSVNEFTATVSHPTKRDVLQTVSRLYDPLGILGPYTIILKILLQNIWKIKPDWDDALPVDISKAWKIWSDELIKLEEFTIQRCAINSNDCVVDLHIFSDASPQAYGAAAYVRSREASGECMVRLLCAKNRVAPLKGIEKGTLTIPKLELTGALIASRLQSFLVKHIHVNQVYLWTDSTIALYWIKGDISKYKTYVANRVKEIRQLTDNCTWSYCPGSSNPADLLTRGMRAQDFLNSKLWTDGPSWLAEERQYWPRNPNEIVCDVENAALLMTRVETYIPENIVKIENYSSYNRLVRVVAYVLRFVNIMKRNKSATETLSVEERNNSEKYLIKLSQQHNFGNEIDDLKRNSKIDRSSKIFQFTPFLDKDNFLRIGGRLQNAEMDFDNKHPIILSNKCYLSKLIILEQHNILHHSGVNAILAAVRQRYWIIKGRQLVKSVLSTCIQCKRMRGKAASEPFAPLPRDRLSAARPFQTTGVDFAGPLYITATNEETKKVYIMLFTCAVIRAVHLELVTDLTSESCIRGLQRFIARRGLPATIYSDNAKTFKRAALELNELESFLTTGKGILEFAAGNRIEWKFIIERAAWWGGFWERMVRSVKTALKSTIGRAVLNYDNLNTVLIEVEATINSRPLTYVGDDHNDVNYLTPNDFLIGYQKVSFPQLPTKVTSRDNLITIWKQREALLRKFWKKWTTDYLQQLRSAHANVSAKSSRIKVGDVMLLNETGVSRLVWKMVVVKRVYTGRDGNVRACDIMLGNRSVVRRPVQLLHPLELSAII